MPCAIYYKVTLTSTFTICYRKCDRLDVRTRPYLSLAKMMRGDWVRGLFLVDVHFDAHLDSRNHRILLNQASFWLPWFSCISILNRIPQKNH